MASITTRVQGDDAKGSPLTNVEVDNNFINLNTAKYESGDSPSFGAVKITESGILNFEYDSDKQFYFEMPSGGASLNISKKYGNVKTLIASFSRTDGTLTTYAPAIFNQGSLDADFRVESNDNTHALFVDGGTSKVGINNNNPSYRLHVGGAIVAGTAETIDPDAMPYSTGIGYIADGSGWGAPGIAFNSTGNVGDTAAIGFAGNTMYFAAGDGTNANSFLTLLNFDRSQFAINDNSLDMDFRVESDGYSHALFVDAQHSRVGINVGSPSHTFEVQAGAANRIATFFDTGTNGGAMYNGAPVLSVSRRSNGLTSQNGEIFTVGRDNSSSESFNLSESIFTVRSNSVVVNESGANVDFRVESDNNEYMLWVDASDDVINIRTGSTSNTSTDINKTVLAILNQDTKLNGSQNYTADIGADIDFMTHNYAGNTFVTGKYRWYSRSNRSGGVISPYGYHQWFTNTTPNTSGVTLSNVFSITTGEVNVNEESNDIDFRVESNASTHALFVRGSDGFVGINSSSPSTSTAKLDVQGGYIFVKAGGTNDLRIGSDGSNDIYMPSGQNLNISASDRIVFKTGSGLPERLRIENSGDVIINETSADQDFRVESDSNNHALFVRGSDSRVIFGGSSTINGANGEFLTGSGASSTTYFAIRNNTTSATTSASTRLDLGVWTNNTAYPTPSGALTGSINFMAQGNNAGYATSQIKSYVLTGGDLQRESHIAQTIFHNKDSTAASAIEYMRFDGAQRAVVINEQSYNNDFRVESNSNEYMLFVDGGQNKVCIGTDTVAETRALTVTDGMALSRTHTYDQNWVFTITHDSSNEYGTLYMYPGVTETQSTAGLTIMDSNARDMFHIYSSGSSEYGTVFNQDSYDADFRVESYNYGNAFLVDAWSDSVRFFKNGADNDGVRGIDFRYQGLSTFVCDHGYRSMLLNNISGGTHQAILFQYGTVDKGSITSTSSGITYNTTSDRRLKDNIETITDGTDKLMAMNPVTHTWIADPDAPAVHGFIAQEMQEVIPEAVSGDPEGEEMMSMDYGRITPVIVAALQDAHKEIKALKSRIEELEAK